MATSGTTPEIDKMRPAESHLKALKLREQCGVEFYNKYSHQFVNVPCPACGADGEEVFKKYGYLHKKCTVCNTMWCSHRPTEKLLSDYYSNWEATKYWTQLLLETDRERKALQYTPRVEMLVKIMNKAGGFEKNLAVDIGAGSGAFAIALKNSGCFENVLAVDFDSDCIAACSKSGLKVLQGSVHDVHGADLLTMNDLIEHVFDPKLFLKQCHTAINENGFIAIACPNGEGFDFSIMKENTVNITPPEHLNYFNPVSISRLLEKTGFEIVSIETPGILDAQIVIRAVAENRVDLSDNKYLEHLLIHGDEKTIQSFQEFLILNKLSSHMLVVARKR